MFCCSRGYLTFLSSTSLCLVLSFDASVKHKCHWGSDLFLYPAAKFSLYFLCLCICIFHFMHLETSF